MASNSSSMNGDRLEGKYSAVDEYGFVRAEDFNYKSYENFFSEYTAVLARRAARWEKLMKNGKKTTVKVDSTVKRFCRKGIPMQYRRLVWMNVSGAQKRLEKNPGLYARFSDENFESSPADNDLVQAIKTDIERTFPDNVHFREGRKKGDKLSPLKKVLTAIGRYKKEVGYCQGMNYVAALMLLIIEDEESVFWLFVCLLENILPEYYSNSMIGLRTDMDVLDSLVRERYLDLSTCLDREDVNWVLLASKWFICLYADVLPTETVLRIWDCMFVEGTKILFRVALSLINLRTAKALAATDMPEIIEAFRDVGKEVDVLECHSFMQSCFIEKIPLRMAHVRKLRETCEEKLKREEAEAKMKKEEKMKQKKP